MKQNFNAKACKSSYVMLCGIWVIIGCLYIYLCFRDGHSLKGWSLVFLILSVAALFAGWLNGLRVSVIGDRLIVRNGLYQIRECAMSDIRIVKVESVQFERFRNDIGIPKIVVRFHDKAIPPILINAKPLSGDDLGTFWEIMEANGLCPVRKRVNSKKK